MQPSIAQKRLHENAVNLSRARKRADAELARAIRLVYESDAYRALGWPTLYKYCSHELGLEDWETYAFAALVKKSSKIPALAQAMESGALSLSKAARIVGVVNRENATRLVPFAIAHTAIEINREKAKIDPKAAKPSKTKHIAEGLVEISTMISEEACKKLERVRSLEAQRGLPSEMGHAIEAAIEEYLEKRDPIRKAERAKTRAEKRDGARPTRENVAAKSNSNRLSVAAAKSNKIHLNSCTYKIRRVRLTTAEKNAVVLRDAGRCTYVYPNGSPCGSDRYLDVHHVIPVQDGGSNEQGNLRTLCSSCHDLIHQLCFPLEKAWLSVQSPHRDYVAEGKFGSGRPSPAPSQVATARLA